jgi:flagellar hook-basal body complex protein FliE
MSVSGIGNIPSPLQALQTARAEAQTAPNQPTGPDFSERVSSALDGLHAAQSDARAAATAFELGETEDLASVMVKQQVASLSMQLTLNVRNKALGAYRDIMNMPV